MSGELLVLGVAGVAVTGVALNRLVERTMERMLRELDRPEPDRPRRTPLEMPRYRREKDPDEEREGGCPLCGEDHRRGGSFAAVV